MVTLEVENIIKVLAIMVVLIVMSAPVITEALVFFFTLVKKIASYISV
ncbi:hypothetical protein [Bartonella rattaustraliani]|nr:hypothetical protein [Bartonella rattaustraliani]